MNFVFLFGIFLSPALAVETPASPFQYRNYTESRFEFRKNCQTLNLDCSSFQVPSKSDEDLSIDYGTLRNDRANRLLIVVCGTHGAEGPVGCGLLNSMMTSWTSHIKDKAINILYVHAANPFGFKNSRRVTENNIDLNRNFLTGDRPKNDGYQKLQANLEPQGQAGHIILGFWKLSVRMIWRLITRDFSLPEMRQAVASGQYISAKGMFYGGEKPEPQMEFFKELFAKHFQGLRDIVLIDIHTGLGKRGVMHMMPTDSISDSAKALMYRLLPSEGGDKKTFELTLSNTKGFYKTYGSFSDFAQQAGAPGQTVLALTMEFGTLGDDIISQLRSLNRMVMENQGKQFGYSSESNQFRVKNDYMELFAPASPEWQSEISQKTNSVFSLIHKNL